MTQINRLSGYVKLHMASVGTLLFAYGAFFLYAVIRTGWIPSDGAIVTHSFSSLVLKAPMISPYLVPAFFVTSLPALLIGALMLCSYTVGVLRSGLTVDSEHVAVLLTVSGLAYVVLGAWPLQQATNFPWTWQKQIMDFGAGFAWVLYLLSVVMLVLGAASLYLHSRVYHRQHPELAYD
jgi:hypothetical protein